MPFCTIIFSILLAKGIVAKIDTWSWMKLCLLLYTSISFAYVFIKDIMDVVDFDPEAECAHGSKTFWDYYCRTVVLNSGNVKQLVGLWLQGRLFVQAGGVTTMLHQLQQNVRRCPTLGYLQSFLLLLQLLGFMFYTPGVVAIVLPCWLLPGFIGVGRLYDVLCFGSDGRSNGCEAAMSAICSCVLAALGSFFLTMLVCVIGVILSLIYIKILSKVLLLIESWTTQIKSWCTQCVGNQDTSLVQGGQGERNVEEDNGNLPIGALKPSESLLVMVKDAWNLPKNNCLLRGLDTYQLGHPDSPVRGQQPTQVCFLCFFRLMVYSSVRLIILPMDLNLMCYAVTGKMTLKILGLSNVRGYDPDGGFVPFWSDVLGTFGYEFLLRPISPWIQAELPHFIKFSWKWL